MGTTKYVIPAGTDFSQPNEASVAFFAWLAANKIDPGQIDPNNRAVIVHGKTWAISATRLDGSLATWPLSMPQPLVVTWLDLMFGPKAGPMDDQAELIEKLRAARQREADAKAEAEEMRAEILRVATERGIDILLVNGEPVLNRNVIFDKAKRDYAGLQRNYPDLVEQYTSYYDETRLEFVK